LTRLAFGGKNDPGRQRLGGAPVIEFEIRSSTGEDAYQVIAARDGEVIRFTCTCSAGAFGDHCKHRTALLSGDTSTAIVGAERLDELLEMLRGSAILVAWQGVTAADAAATRAKKDLAAAKADLALAMRGMPMKGRENV
jgi:hypothetical protein